MSDSNVGGWQNRSIGNNLFIVSDTINNAIHKTLSVDITLQDIANFFWFAVSGDNERLKDEKFALVEEMN